MPNPGFDHNLGTDDDIVNWKLRLLPIVVMWPAVYILASATLQQWRELAARPRVRRS